MGLKTKVISVIKRILFLEQTDSLSVFYILKRWNVRFGRYFYHKKYSSSDIISILRELGVGEGSNIFIHSSWDSFYNFDDDIDALLESIINLVGPAGTVAMPAVPVIKPGKRFNVNRTPTSAGLLAELFRRSPGVLRSRNVRHSVCALGPLAEYLTCDHHTSLVCFDEHSPYYRICERGFTVIALGLPKYYIGTIQYVSQAILRNDIPFFSQFYTDKYETVEYVDSDGVIKSYRQIQESQSFSRKSYWKKKYVVKRYFDKDKYRLRRISNLNIMAVDANYANEKLIELAKKGIFLYTYPFA